MKIHLRRNTEIVQIPQNFVLLEEITESHYKYKITYRVFPSRALMLNTTTCVLQFSRIPFAKTEKKVFNTSDPSEMVKNLLLQSAKRVDSIKSEEEEWFHTVYSDFTKRISNANLGRLIREGGVRSVREFDFVSSRELTLDNSLEPVLDVSTNRMQLGTTHNNSVFKSISHGLLERNIDPAKFVGNPTNAIISADASINGTFVRGKCNCPDDRIQQDRILIESLLSDKQKVENQKDSIRDDDMVKVSRRVQRDWIEVVERVNIPREALSGMDRFYVGFRILNNKGLYINTTSAPVEHVKLVQKFSIPVRPPSIVVSRIKNSPKTIIQVQQNDKNGSAIQVYKRVIDSVRPQNDATYDFVEEVVATVKDGPKVIEDSVTTNSHVIYRAIAINESETLGSEFGSRVIGKRNQESNAVSVVGRVDDDSIVVEVGNIPPEVVSVELRKLDKTLKQKTPTHVGMAQTTNVVEDYATSFSDDSVVLYRVYEYTAYLYYKNGSVKKSPNPCVIEYNPVEKNIISVSTTAPVISQTGNDYDVKFDIVKNVIQTDTDALRSFLNQQGFLAEYQDEIIANREKIRDLFGIEVLRTNLKTGEVENFGVIATDEFSDLSLGVPNGVKPLEPGVEYIYTLKTHTRTIETLFTSLTRTVETGTNTSYELRPSKWHHPLTLTSGNIVSEESLRRNHAKSSFTFGNLGNIRRVHVSIPSPQPSISDAVATVVSNKKVEIQWHIQGDVNKIDHFILILENMGMKTIVGKCHNITETSYFSFIDDLENNESGRVLYTIVPVFFDYTRGTEVKTNSVVVK